jgi:nucleoside-triphosphatase THEP1
MAKVVLLTGVPGSGKTTALKRILSRLTVKVGGFYTEEIRERGSRVGFKIATMEGHEGILAHIQIQGQPRIGKYGVNLEAIEKVAVESLLRSQEGYDIIVIDEIGPMEVLSEKFCQTVRDLLEADVQMIGSIVKRSMPFTDEVKKHSRVIIFEIQRDNQDQIVDEVLRYLETSI